MPQARPSSPVTYALIAINVAVFVLQLQARDALFTDFALWPLNDGFQPWQIVTSAFLHGGEFHLLANMLGLWMFGRDVEWVMGSGYFGLAYGASVLTASAAQLVVVSMGPDPVPTVGASGGLFGVLAAFAWLFPRRKIVPLIPPIPMPAPVFVALYAAFELYAGVTGTISGVAHFAHLGGLVGGLIVTAQWRSSHLQRSG